MLNCFFVVTRSGSVYEVSNKKRRKGWPTVKRIAGDKHSGIRKGGYLRNGSLVGIGDLGVCLFSPEPKYGRSFERMNTVCWGGTTSAPVALFLERSSAEVCLEGCDRAVFSARYRNETLATLKEIGDDHPVFVIGDSVKRLFGLAA